MDKTKVYSWRLSSHLKDALEEAARRERVSIASLVERIVVGWLAEARAKDYEADAEQARLQGVIAPTFGTIRGGNPDRSTSVRQAVHRRLTRRDAR
ncbi:MAG: hypothetical protein ACREXW_13040 [Gammaproteobacteria bacterium]